MFETYLVYNFVLVFSVLFAWLSEKSVNLRKLLLTASFSVLYLTSVLRFNIGHDYWNYVLSFKEIYNNEEIELLDKLSFGLVCKAFSFSPRGYLFVFAFYSFFTLFFLFKTLIKRNILPMGIFIFICYNYFFTSLDQIRQTAAIFIFIYSIQFIEEKQFKNFLFSIILASLFHFSAIFLLPFYFLNTKKINIWILFLMIIIFTAGYFSGLWENLRIRFIRFIPIYNYFADIAKQLESQSLGTGLGFIYLLVINLIIIFNLRHDEKSVLYHMSAIGVLFFLFSAGNLNIDRFANYFLMAQTISIPYIIRKSQSDILRVFILLTAFFMLQLYISTSPRGTSPYQSIFSNNYRDEIFFYK